MPKAQTINTEVLEALTILPRKFTKINFILVGCGGTGSWLAMSIGRVARILADKFNIESEAVFVDPDTVEEKNIFRQNFCYAEIGHNKAECLAFRVNAAWGMSIGAYTVPFDKAPVEIRTYDNTTLYVIMGCVDGKARADIAKACSYNTDNVWWIDCGNENGNGQVLIGGGIKKDVFQIAGKIIGLPLPIDQMPSLLQNNSSMRIGIDTSKMSCAEIAMIDEQGLTTNQMVASIASDYLVGLLLTGKLDHFQTFFDLRSGSMRSTFITPKNIKIHKTKGQ
jgi:PRTRC genetic system ThiF family protein